MKISPWHLEDSAVYHDEEIVAAIHEGRRQVSTVRARLLLPAILAILQLDRPLDFYAVTDHAAYLGVLRALADPGHPLADDPEVKRAIPASTRGITPSTTSASWRTRRAAGRRGMR